MRNLKNSTVAGIIVLMVAIISATPALAVGNQNTNLVTNPGFEGGTYVADSVGNMRVPNSWEAFSLSEATMHYEAELHPSHVNSGTYSARIFSSYENHNAGLRQKVSGLTPGATYRLTAHVFLWSTETPVVDTPSTAFMSAFVGADPTGGKDPASANRVETSARQMDSMLTLTVDVTPQVADMWIFLRSSTEWPVSRNDAFWDDVSLVKIADGDGAQPTAQPTTGTGGTTGTTGGTGELATPDAEGRIIHTVVAGDTLSGIAFAYGVTMDQIRQLNGMTSDVVMLGQQLVISGGDAAPTAEPTEEPSEEPAETEEAVEGEDAEPEPTEEVVAQEVVPGKLCVISFMDANGNGFREPDETGAGSISFSLSDGASVLSTLTTDASGSLCFEALEPGSYSISWTAVEYKPSTDQTWNASLTEGVTLNHEFGLQSIVGGESDDAADDMPETSQSSGVPSWIIALVAALGIILFLAGIGAGVYFLILRRRKV